MVYTTIYRVSTIQGGAGFLPSTLGEAHRRFINPFCKNSLSVALWLQDIFPSTLGSLSTAEKHLTLAPLGNDRIFAIYLPFMVCAMFFSMFFLSFLYTGPGFRRVEHSSYQQHQLFVYRIFWALQRAGLSLSLVADDFLAPLFTSHHESMALNECLEFLAKESFHMFENTNCNFYQVLQVQHSRTLSLYFCPIAVAALKDVKDHLLES